MWRSSAETWVNENKSITALCYNSVHCLSFPGTLWLVPVSASARQQRLIWTLVGTSSMALSAGEYHPGILNFSLHYPSLLTFNILAGDCTWCSLFRALIDSYLNTLKWGLVHSWQFSFPENNFPGNKLPVYLNWDTQRDWRKILHPF